MGKVKEAGMTIHEYFQKDKQKFIELWNQFMEDYKDNSDAFSNISIYCPEITKLEGHMEAYAIIAEDLFNDFTLWGDYDELVENMCDQAIEMLEQNCKTEVSG